MLPVWILFLIACLFWGFYIVRPFLVTETPAQDRKQGLIEEKRGYLFALRDAETDHAAGKLSDADYHSVRTKLEEKVAVVMQALDEVEGTPERKVERALESLRKREV
jgi:hypothetical protein